MSTPSPFVKPLNFFLVGLVVSIFLLSGCTSGDTIVVQNTRLEKLFDGNVSGELNVLGNIYTDNNIYAGYVHATDFITSSKVPDVSDGKKALDNLDNISYWLVTDAKSDKKVIDYDAHYAGVKWIKEKVDYSKPVIKEKLVEVCVPPIEIMDSNGEPICHKELVSETTYPYSIFVEEKGLSMETRVAELEKMVYELVTELCKQNDKYEWCN